MKLKNFNGNNLKIIDIAACNNYSMFLVDVRYHSLSIKEQINTHENIGESKRIYLWGEKVLQAGFEYLDTHHPQLQEVERLNNDPELKIEIIYWAYNRFAVVDNEGGLWIWGHDFEGFKQDKPKLFYVFPQPIK